MPSSPKSIVLPLARRRLCFNAALGLIAACGFFPAADAWESQFKWSLFGLGVSSLCLAIALFQLWPLLFPPFLVTFEPEGLRTPSLFNGVIPWRMIRACDRPGGRVRSTLRIFVEEGAYAGLTRRASWLMRPESFDIELAFGDVDRQKAFESCAAFIAAARRDARAGAETFSYGRRLGDYTLESIQKGEARALWFAVLLCLLIAGQMAYLAFGLA